MDLLLDTQILVWIGTGSSRLSDRVRTAIAAHGDPVDRMLIAHAIHADLTLVTADGLMRRYPVKSLW